MTTQPRKEQGQRAAHRVALGVSVHFLLSFHTHQGARPGFQGFTVDYDVRHQVGFGVLAITKRQSTEVRTEAFEQQGHRMIAEVLADG